MTALILISSLLLSFLVLVPLGIKWELEKRLTIPATVLIGVVCAGIVRGIFTYWSFDFPQAILIEIMLIGALSLSLLLWRFYRDPERVPPDNENAILSPADGEIIYVKRIEKGQVPLAEKKGRKFSLSEFTQADVLLEGGYLIGIAMTYLDVHVNRAPVGGTINLVKHIRGHFLSLKIKEAVLQNERNVIVIDNGYFKLGIVQIASRLVRKIIPYVREGQNIQLGKRIGMICFGSQVDLVLPDIPSVNVEVKVGERVKAGLSIVATFRSNRTHQCN